MHVGQQNTAIACAARSTKGDEDLTVCEGSVAKVDAHARQRLSLCLVESKRVGEREWELASEQLDASARQRVRHGNTWQQEHVTGEPTIEANAFALEQSRRDNGANDKLRAKKGTLYTL